MVFPLDVRNCVACHAESDAWNDQPSRVACLACHDSPAAALHATMMTLDPTPATPYSGDELESCVTCHAGDALLAPRRVHEVAAPYVLPYPR